MWLSCSGFKVPQGGRQTIGAVAAEKKRKERGTGEGVPVYSPPDTGKRGGRSDRIGRHLEGRFTASNDLDTNVYQIDLGYTKHIGVVKRMVVRDPQIPRSPDQFPHP